MTGRDDTERIMTTLPGRARPGRSNVERGKSAGTSHRPPAFLRCCSGDGRAPHRQGARAFTLIELLVVIGIIGVLAALLLPTLNRSKALTRAVACMSNLRQVGVALQLYLGENNNHLPVMRDYSSSVDTNTVVLPTPNVVLASQLGNTSVLCCPADNTGTFQQTGSSYSWNSLLNGQDAGHLQVFGMTFNSTQIPLMFDKGNFHIVRGPGKAVNYLYGDSHIQNLLVVEGTTQ